MTGCGFTHLTFSRKQAIITNRISSLASLIIINCTEEMHTLKYLLSAPKQGQGLKYDPMYQLTSDSFASEFKL